MGPQLNPETWKEKAFKEATKNLGTTRSSIILEALNLLSLQYQKTIDRPLDESQVNMKPFFQKRLEEIKKVKAIFDVS